MKPLAFLLPVILSASAYAADPPNLELWKEARRAPGGKLLQAIEESVIEERDARRIEPLIIDMENARRLGHDLMLPPELYERAGRNAFGKVLVDMIRQVPIMDKLQAWSDRQIEGVEKRVSYHNDIFSIGPSFNIFSELGVKAGIRLPRTNLDVRIGYDYSGGLRYSVNGVYRFGE